MVYFVSFCVCFIVVVIVVVMIGCKFLECIRILRVVVVVLFGLVMFWCKIEGLLFDWCMSLFVLFIVVMVSLWVSLFGSLICWLVLCRVLVR